MYGEMGLGRLSVLLSLSGYSPSLTSSASSRDIVPSSGGLSERIDETGVRRVEVLGKAITIACG